MPGPLLSDSYARLTRRFQAVFTASSSSKKIFLSRESVFEFDLRASIHRIFDRRAEGRMKASRRGLGTYTSLVATQCEQSPHWLRLK